MKKRQISVQVNSERHLRKIEAKEEPEAVTSGEPVHDVTRVARCVTSPSLATNEQFSQIMAE